jgi:PPOX class probable F420-dependent enzyme
MKVAAQTTMSVHHFLSMVANPNWDLQHPTGNFTGCDRFLQPLGVRQWQTDGMDLSDALDLARTRRFSVLVTMRTNGRPQLSNVGHLVGDDGLIRISITAERAKYKNLLRDPWAALDVARDDFYAYAVIEGDVELSPVASRVDDEIVDELVEIYRGIAGEHENWDDFREAMVREQRVVARLRPTRAYGML